MPVHQPQQTIDGQLLAPMKGAKVGMDVDIAVAGRGLLLSSGESGCGGDGGGYKGTPGECQSMHGSGTPRDVCRSGHQLPDDVPRVQHLERTSVGASVGLEGVD